MPLLLNSFNETYRFLHRYMHVKITLQIFIAQHFPDQGFGSRCIAIYMNRYNTKYLAFIYHTFWQQKIPFFTFA